MGTISRVKTWSSNETLTAADLNAEFNNILNNVNSNSLDNTNLDTTATYEFNGLLVGHSTRVTTSAAYNLQALGTGDADSGALSGRFSADASGPKYSFVKSRHATIGSNTIVQDNDLLGTIEWMAADGVDFATPGATIFARVNGTPGANDLPTEVVIATTADGASTVTENVRVLSTGVVEFAGTIQPTATDGASLGTTSVNWSDLFLDSGAVINFDGGDMTITHSANTLTFAGGATVLGSTSTIQGDMTIQDNVKATLGTGGDADIYYDGTDLIIDPRVVGSGDLRVLNQAEVRGDAGAAGILELTTAELTVVDGDELGRINFVAPLEESGTDAIRVAASIWAEADATFAADNNTTDIVFAAATSEIAGAVMRMSKTALYPHADDGMSLGITNTKEWSDLHLAAGATITFDNSDIVLTHSSNTLTLSGGSASGFGGTITALNNATENELVTVGSTTTELDAEANLTFTGSLLTVTGDANITSELWVNETANADQTIGITINQGASDDQAFALKSSDVAHGYTSSGAETDTYFALQKSNGGLGGLLCNVYAEGGLSVVNQISTYGGVADTTHSTSVGALVNWYTAELSGDAVDNITANGMVYTFQGRVGGANRTLFGIDEDGDFQYDGADGGAWDAYEDAHICRAMATATLDPKTIVRSKWDEMVKYNKQTMIDIGVLGYCSPEDEAAGHTGLVNGSQLQRVFLGAHWQAYVDRQEMKEEIESLRSELMLLKEKN